MQPVMQRIGGSFAPPLTDDLLARYDGLIDALPAGRVKEALTTLVRCVRRWWELPDPQHAPSRKHPSGVGLITNLLPDHAADLFDLIPWSHRSNGTGRPDELESIQAVCDEITDRDLRNAAFHLLWHVIELDLDREPLTNDKL